MIRGIRYGHRGPYGLIAIRIAVRPAMRICAIAASLRGDGGIEVYDGYYMTLRNILGQ